MKSTNALQTPAARHTGRTRPGSGIPRPEIASRLTRRISAGLGSSLQWAQQAGAKLGLGPRPDTGAAIDAIARLTHSRDAAESSQAIADALVASTGYPAAVVLRYQAETGLTFASCSPAGEAKGLVELGHQFTGDQGPAVFAVEHGSALVMQSRPTGPLTAPAWARSRGWRTGIVAPVTHRHHVWGVAYLLRPASAAPLVQDIERVERVLSVASKHLFDGGRAATPQHAQPDLSRDAAGQQEPQTTAVASTGLTSPRANVVVRRHVTQVHGAPPDDLPVARQPARVQPAWPLPTGKAPAGMHGVASLATPAPRRHEAPSAPPTTAAVPVQRALPAVAHTTPLAQVSPASAPRLPWEPPRLSAIPAPVTAGDRDDSSPLAGRAADHSRHKGAAPDAAPRATPASTAHAPRPVTTSQVRPPLTQQMAEPARMAVAAPRPPSDLAAVHTQPVAAASRPVAISLDGLSVDPASERTQVGQVRIALSGTEFSLLYALAASAGRVVSSDELMRAGWSGEAVREGTLDVTMHRLRKRLAQAPGGEGLIRTVRGQGYVLSAAPASRNAAA